MLHLMPRLLIIDLLYVHDTSGNSSVNKCNVPRGIPWPNKYNCSKYDKTKPFNKYFERSIIIDSYDFSTQPKIWLFTFRPKT